ncbi:MAG TPA: NAD(P)H-dependent oxidoreductase subunit E, partial [Anaerovoracaceae bacterium]|nr:NAD(P)H-dependent oxidoreductase subunit E [Anaerovoracaceae bacterium]
MTNLKELDKNSNLEDILKRYPRERRFTLAIMQDIQERYHYLPRESLYAVGKYLDIPISKLYSMATFYKAFSMKAKGENIIKVCDGTA